MNRWLPTEEQITASIEKQIQDNLTMAGLMHHTRSAIRSPEEARRIAKQQGLMRIKRNVRDERED